MSAEQSFPCHAEGIISHPLLLRCTNNLHTVQAQGLGIPLLLLFLPQAHSKCRISISLWLSQPQPQRSCSHPPHSILDTLCLLTLYPARMFTHPGADCLHQPRKAPHPNFSPVHISATDSFKHSTSHTSLPLLLHSTYSSSLQPSLWPTEGIFWGLGDAALPFQPLCCYIRLGAGCMSHP